jgi:hypothetical protein
VLTGGVLGIAALAVAVSAAGGYPEAKGVDVLTGGLPLGGVLGIAALAVAVSAAGGYPEAKGLGAVTGGLLALVATAVGANTSGTDATAVPVGAIFVKGCCKRVALL